MQGFFHNKKILVTGGTGLIGSALIRRLKEEGALTADLSLSNFAGNEMPIDLISRDSIKKALSGKKFDMVFHLAAAGASPDGGKNQSLFRTNAEGTENLLLVLEEMPPCPLVAAGSWTEYGNSKSGVMNENDSCHPLSLYGISKLSATLLVSAWAKKTSRPAAVARFFNVYGPGEAAERLTPTLVGAYSQNQSPVLSNPDLRRDFIYVADIVEALLRIARLNLCGEIINVGTGRSLSLFEYDKIVRSVFNTKAEPIWNAALPKPWDVPAACADIGKLERLLNWSPAFSVQQALQNFLRLE